MSAYKIKNNIDSVLEFLPEEKQTLLIVDDEENNLQLLKRTFRGKYNLLFAHNGKEALEVVKEHADEISLIVSDQKMPVMEGTEFLKHIDEINPQIIRILLTGHLDSDVLVSAINECNLFQYFLKPFEPEELKIAVANGILKHSMASNNKLYYKELKELFYKTIRAISNTLDTKDAYTSGHSLRVTLYSMILVNELDLAPEYMEEIEIAGLLHDIGKIAMPKKILCKNGKLTDDEFRVMKAHPGKGERIVFNIKKLQLISSWVKTHHEKWDGRGYPDGLKGEEIPLAGRIIAISDTYDAMTSTRPYRTALSHKAAIDEIKRCAGTQFDPTLAKLFVDISDKIDYARQHPVEMYEKYSLLAKNINFEISSEAAVNSDIALRKTPVDSKEIQQVKN